MWMHEYQAIAAQKDSHTAGHHNIGIKEDCQLASEIGKLCILQLRLPEAWMYVQAATKAFNSLDLSDQLVDVQSCNSIISMMLLCLRLVFGPAMRLALTEIVLTNTALTIKHSKVGE